MYFAYDLDGTLAYVAMHASRFLARRPYQRRSAGVKRVFFPVGTDIVAEIERDGFVAMGW